MDESRAVLVVDDEPGMREVSRAALASEGFEVLLARDGVEALELLERHGGRIRLVVTDAVMPRMGGRELLWQLSQRCPGVPVLMASGILEDPDFAVGMEVAPLGFISKPFDPRELVRAVRAALEIPPEISTPSA